MQGEIQQRVASKAVIVHEGKVLILRESSLYKKGTNTGRYDFPGGKIKPRETFVEALQRECREECGLDVEVGDVLYAGEWRPVINGVHLQIFGIFFLCTPKHTNIILSGDHDDFKWIPFSDADKFDLIPPNREILEKLAKKASL